MEEPFSPPPWSIGRFVFKYNGLFSNIMDFETYSSS
jgi:hypothetical protein